MKLIPLIILMISLAVDSERHENFPFPPQFHGAHPEMFNSEKQFYLPPESHTPIPYFPMKNFNNLPFPYLPPTVTKSPSGSPSPFSIVSSTLMPVKSDDDDDDDDDKPSSPIPPHMRSQYNRTQRATHQPERKEMRPIPKNYHPPIDRIDTKLLPYAFSANSESTTQHPGMQSMSPRSIMISDIQRDHGMDQMKAASYQGSQYLPQPGVFISTTETAIPILRLSNEMDLDGSFSYEALGADQTHYVQHSRMENMGPDKEEQVVEGSYSYVGDNGKTYTVHYIADSNGFRASGDHLPVPPPVPEIIQRAVQYNLAEELKKPPHLKSWNEEEKENELSESEKRNRFAVAPPRLSNLFTGKTPESFSHSFSQPSNSQNNLVAAASSQTPIQTVDFTDQMQKQNSGTISPQITFLASQGAHVPSVNAQQQQQQQQQSIGRIFTTERPTMPQLVNYQANIKESDEESNKALWRWQYGLNANSNQNMEKNLISRSSAEDDISINFNDMTADQYTKMIQQQLQPSVKQTPEITRQFDSSNNQGQYYNNFNTFSNAGNENQYSNNNYNTVNPVTSESQYSTEKITPSTHSIDWYKQQNDYNQQNNNNQQYEYNTKEPQSEISQTSRPKLITHDQFVPRSQMVTQTYNYDDNGFESRRTRILTKNNPMDMNLNVIPLNYEKSIDSNRMLQTSFDNFNKDKTTTTTQEPTTITTIGNIKFTDFIVSDDKNDFKPIFAITEMQPKETTTTTTEANMEEVLEENIFLKNLFRASKSDVETGNNIKNEDKNLKPKPLPQPEKFSSPKYIQFDPKPYNEIKTIKKKPIDIADIMNYLSRNQFESNKMRSKPKQMHNNFKQKNEMQYFTNDEDQEMAEDKVTRNFRTLQQQEELRGVIKNYKVLQRSNHLSNGEHDDGDGLNRNLSPPPVKMVNLPPLGRAGPTMKSYLPPVYV